MDNVEPLIRVRDTWMSFPGKAAGQNVHVLENINFDIRPGEFVCIVGPSGCGKSTMLNILGGFLKETRGDVNELRGRTGVQTELVLDLDVA